MNVATASEPEGDTDFTRLSEAAQDLIVRSMLGEFESGPPDMPESVREEIQQWTEAKPKPDEL